MRFGLELKIEKGGVRGIISYLNRIVIQTEFNKKNSIARDRNNRRVQFLVRLRHINKMG